MSARMHTVYIIQSLKTAKYYTGVTKNLTRRLKQHNANQTKSLKNQGPFKVVYTQTFCDTTDARKRELQIKRCKGGQAFKKLINE